MTGGVLPLRDYDELRDLGELTIDVVDVAQEAVVLGSAQAVSVLIGPATMDRRRRRGGGGVVLLRPGDLWIDAWVPTGDPRWTPDVTAQSVSVGRWWKAALEGAVGPQIDLVAERGRSDPSPVCFGATSPGELVTPEGKLVGLTQWRPRQGALVSGLLPVRDSRDLVGVVAGAEGIGRSLNHPSATSLGLVDRRSTIVADFVAAAGAASVRTLRFPPS